MARVTPAVVVRVTGEGGRLEAVDLSDDIESFSLEDNAKLADKLSLTVDNFDLRYLDDPRFRTGSDIEVQWGYLGELTEVRRLKIASLKGGKTLTIEAHGEAVKMDRFTNGRTFENMTRSAVAKKIAAEYKFATDALIEDTEVVYPSIAQAKNETDAQFLKRLAKREGFDFYVKKSGLHFHRPKYDQPPIRRVVYYNGPDAGDVLDFDIEEDAKNKKAVVRVEGRNPITRKKATAVGSSETTKGRPTLASNEGLVTTDKVNQQTGEITTVTQPKLAPTNAKAQVVPTPETNEKAIKRQAEAAYRRQHETAVKLSLTMVGDPQVAARKVIEVAGIGARLSGLYYIQKVVHRLDRSGYVMSLELSRDGHNGYGDKRRDVPTKGTQNKQQAKAGTAGELEPFDSVNQRTGETRTVFRRKV